MLLLDQIREKKLIDLAKACFDPPPTAAEEKVLRDSASSSSNPDAQAANTQRPEIRPDLVRWLVTDKEAAANIDPKGLRAFGITLPDKLDLQNCRVLVPLHFQNCTIKSEIDLRSAETRSVHLLDSSFEGIIRADRINVDGPLYLRGSSFSREIRLVGGKINGALDCLGAKLIVKGGNALSADRAKIGGIVNLRTDYDSSGTVLQRFESQGTIRLLGAKINGDLSCSGAKLRVGEGNALYADGAEIRGSVYLNLFQNKASGQCEAFESTGTIRLLSSQIKGILSCSGAKMRATEENTLFADSVRIGGGVFLNKGFESTGTIRLLGARIGGDLTFIGAKIPVVVCKNLHLSGDMFWMGIQESGKVILDLTGASVKNLGDDRESWPATGHLILDRLAYAELTLHEPPSEEQVMNDSCGPELPFNVDGRIEWLMLQTPDRRIEPQPWMQLAKLLEAKGNRKGAKRVVFNYRVLLAKEKEFHPLNWLLKLLFRLQAFRLAWPYFRHPNRSWAIAFAWLEEKPIRICWSIVFTLTWGTLIFAGAFSSNAMIASVQIQPNALLPMPSGESRNLSAHYPLSQSFLYTLENAVPLVKLGMDEKWMPDPKHKPQPWLPQFRWLDWLGWFNSYWFLVVSRVLLIFLGWFQAGVLGAALLRRFKE
jgi:hypothetical protein